ncbi:MAG: ferritin-like domain-containing protein [Chitinivorax sp.]
MLQQLLNHNFDRRAFLRGTSTATLSAGAMLLLAGNPAAAASVAKGAAEPHAGDIGILNVALGLEHQGINAYTLGATSGLLQKPVLDIALKFKDDHKIHRDLLAKAITQLGGTPVNEKPLEVYAKALNAASLKSQEDILRLALSLELGASNAYLSVLPSFKDSSLSKVAGQIMADEVAHWAILNNALGQALPKAMYFGG